MFCQVDQLWLKDQQLYLPALENAKKVPTLAFLAHLAFSNQVLKMFCQVDQLWLKDQQLYLPALENAKKCQIWHLPKFCSSYFALPMVAWMPGTNLQSFLMWFSISRLGPTFSGMPALKCSLKMFSTLPSRNRTVYSVHSVNFPFSQERDFFSSIEQSSCQCEITQWKKQELQVLRCTTWLRILHRLEKSSVARRQRTHMKDMEPGKVKGNSFAQRLDPWITTFVVSSCSYN